MTLHKGDRIMVVSDRYTYTKKGDIGVVLDETVPPDTETFYADFGVVPCNSPTGNQTWDLSNDENIIKLEPLRLGRRPQNET